MLNLNPNKYYSENILSEDKLKLALEKLRGEGKKIGLCTGSFDLLHPGHITHFISAKKMCDILVVAIAPDNFTGKIKKGKGRPIFSENIRAFMVSQLKPVDFVVLDSRLPEPEILNVIKPDILIKGADYSDEKDPRIIRQREMMNLLGGEIAYTRDEKLSTTDILKYISEKVEID